MTFRPIVPLPRRRRSRQNRLMAVEQRTESERILAAREQYVPRGIATHADRRRARRRRPGRGRRRHARTSISPAGSAARTPATASRPRSPRCTSRSTRYLHQCFMVGIYEPYVEVCRRLAELSPCAGESQKSLLLNSRRRGRRERGQDRARRDRQARRRRLRERLPRPDAADDDDDAQGVVQAAASARSRPRSTARPGPYPYRGVSSDDALEDVASLLAEHEIACVVARAGAGRGRLHRRCPTTSRRASPSSAASTAPSTSTTRCSPASAAPGPSGRSSTTASSRTCSSRGKSLGGGLPLAAVTGRAELMDAPHAGGPRRHVRRQPGRLRRRDRGARRGRARDEFRARSEELGDTHPRPRLEEIATRVDQVGEVRGLGPMLALELVTDRETQGARPPTSPSGRPQAARERGLILLSCGTATATSSASSSRWSSPTTISPGVSRSWRSRLSTPAAG